jgi:hypothetical protein
MADVALCSELDCDKPIYCKGVCKTHYHRAYMAKHRHRTDGARCSVDSCDKAAVTRGWCGMHYDRWATTGTTDKRIQEKLPRGKCAVVGCEELVYVHQRTLCSVHYSRWHRTGDPLTEPQFIRGSAKEFLYEVVMKYEGDDCLTWQFYRAPHGYGKIGFGNKTFNVHRVVCELAHGKPPTCNHYALHSCGNGHLGCCSPKHLYWGTQKENMADAIRHGRMRRKK